MAPDVTGNPRFQELGNSERETWKARNREVRNYEARAAAGRTADVQSREARNAGTPAQLSPARIPDKRQTRARDLSRRLGTLVVFRVILKDPALRELDKTLLLLGRGQTDKAVRHMAAFEAALFERGDNWTDYLTHLLMESENVCIRTCGTAGRAGLSSVLLSALDRELAFLQELSQLRLEDLTGAAGGDDTAGSTADSGADKAADSGADSAVDGVTDSTTDSVLDGLTPWNVSATDLPAAYRDRMERVGSLGYGMFAHSHVFTLSEGKLLPVRHPDPQTLDELPGYEPEREKIIANTEALLNGRPANNVLLYGDAGTGKSSTVKALVNEYADRGLRLVEVKKNQLYELPALMDELAENPLKFILFIDDLSFTANDDNFAALKAILEGSAGGRAENVAVYATSNRRHLIKETLSDRAGDDIHASDTRQELMSLAARFGLTVTFSSPDRERYLYIVRKLAERYGLAVSEAALGVRAEAFAIRAGGRSARVAKQFVELCKAGIYSLE
ncbi:MAG: ATP-binding protein [Oscillibacter sp.]|nr:ATP-binding protein [Oscillibacter sp.]